MPKRILFAALFAASALAACSGYNPSSIYGTPATATPIPTYSANPNITSTSILFSVGATPIPNQPIAMSTPDPAGQPGTPIATVNTDSTGTAKFTGLTPTATYCWQTSYTPPGAAAQVYSVCTLYWQGGLHLGNP